MNVKMINIIGAGLAGLSASVHLAKKGYGCRLISLQPSERAQSVMAEGGINAALDTMGEGDDPSYHFEDTMRGGVYLADEKAVRNLTEHAPEMIKWLQSLGVPFNMRGTDIELRSFGGQKKKRTAYSRSSTGKILMTALIDEVRKYEARGLIKRYSHHRFLSLLTSEAANGDKTSASCIGVQIADCHQLTRQQLYGPVILASGGMNSLFPGLTTGTAVNTGDVTAQVFFQGVSLANLEFIQYHPTTAAIPGKRCLISEAARGEGGRLLVFRDGEPWYFMEEKYPELKNLMPRDVVSREMILAVRDEHCGDQVYLDMTHIEKKVWDRKLSDLREECIRLLGTDPAKDYLQVSPGIHYFMGGIYVNEHHETDMRGLFAAGECACQYHGANRLGGNSMLGAVFGGKVAAESAADYSDRNQRDLPDDSMTMNPREEDSTPMDCHEEGSMPMDCHEEESISKDSHEERSVPTDCHEEESTPTDSSSDGNRSMDSSEEETGFKAQLREMAWDYSVSDEIADILACAMGIFRREKDLQDACDRLKDLDQSLCDPDSGDSSYVRNGNEKKRILLARAMVLSALNRRESRGAHTRQDYPERDDVHFRKTSVVKYDGQEIHLSLCEV